MVGDGERPPRHKNANGCAWVGSGDKIRDGWLRLLAVAINPPTDSGPTETEEVFSEPSRQRRGGPPSVADAVYAFGV